MIDRDDLRVVLAIRNHGRIALAAEHLGVTAAAVTKRLGAIEKKLGVKLFQRTTRRMKTSDEGELCALLATDLLGRFDDLETQVTARSERPTGLIKLVSNTGFGRIHLAPQIVAFHARYPDIHVELHLSNQLPDLLAQGFDAAVWLWGPTSTQWVVSKLASNYRLVVASPSYVQRHGLPRTPADLEGHQCIAMAQRDVFNRLWRLQKLDPRVRTAPVDVKVTGALRSNSGEVCRDWAIAGCGVALRPSWDVTEHLRSGRLVDMLPGYAQLESDVQWIAPFKSNSPRRVTLLKQWLSAAFADPPWEV